MTQPSIVFLDLDGTTLDGPAPKWFQKDPSEFTCDVLSKVNKIFPVVICTGRSANNNTRRIVDKIGLDSYITWNGSEIYWKHELVYQAHAPKDVTAELVKDFEKYNLNVIFNSNKENSYTKNIISKQFMGHAKDTCKYWKDFDNNFNMQKAFVWPASFSPVKKLAKIFPILQDKYGDKLELTLAGENNVMEITPKDISKGNADLWLCNYLNLDPNKAWHFGDSLNDASTKGKIGTLIAVANATDDLKVQADVILDKTCDESAVAHHLKQFIK
ncbi:HAD-IIB family hydrolase [Mycoplasma hafezii]|uniref:HAD-IIB family hydrolase n=1 Tax=Mycoplasma hafezii TaxID=525886 RepID=UPI003CEA90BD